eukprot:g58196.t1
MWGKRLPPRPALQPPLDDQLSTPATPTPEAARRWPRVFLIHGDSTEAAALAVELQQGLKEACPSLQLQSGSTDPAGLPAALQQAERVVRQVVLLTGGVLAEDSRSLKQLRYAVQHAKPLFALYSEKAGWEFGGSESRRAPGWVMEVVGALEAMVFRTKAEREYEFVAMCDELLARMTGTFNQLTPLTEADVQQKDQEHQKWLQEEKQREKDKKDKQAATPDQEAAKQAMGTAGSEAQQTQLEAAEKAKEAAEKAKEAAEKAKEAAEKAKEAAEKALEVERRKAQELLEAERKMQQQLATERRGREEAESKMQQQLATERRGREKAESKAQQQLAQLQAELERLRAAPAATPPRPSVVAAVSSPARSPPGSPRRAPSQPNLAAAPGADAQRAQSRAPVLRGHRATGTFLPLRALDPGALDGSRCAQLALAGPRRQPQPHSPPRALLAAAARTRLSTSSGHQPSCGTTGQQALCTCHLPLALQYQPPSRR